MIAGRNKIHNALNWLGSVNKTAEMIATTICQYRGADKFLARPGRQQASTTENSDVHVSYLLS
jgi:hypothetical protein